MRCKAITLRLEGSYRSLWLPTRIDCLGSDGNCSWKSCEIPLGKYWFSMSVKEKLQNKSLPLTSLVSLPYLLPESTVSEVIGTNVKAEKIKVPTRGKKLSGGVKTLRIRVFPKEKEEWVMKIHQQSRWMYNASLNVAFMHYDKLMESKSISETKLRDVVQNIDT